jgi:hypothetical protein
MDVLTLLQRAWAAGLSLTVEGNRLTIRGPRKAEPIVRELIAHKPDVLDLVRAATVEPTPSDLPSDWHLLWDERAAIMEYDGGLPRERAEAEAFKDILRCMREAGVAPLRINAL